jgi:hypothetical protein
MPPPACHLAQINIARMLYPIEDPGMAGAVAQPKPGTPQLIGEGAGNADGP